MGRHVLKMEPAEAEAHASILAASFLNGFDEPTCEFVHEATPCTKTVSHRVRNCARQANVCQSGRASIEQTITNHADEFCTGCLRPVPECWSIWSI